MSPARQFEPAKDILGTYGVGSRIMKERKVVYR